MANWAIVIGIDDYKLPQLALKSCVNDATRMMRWLTDQAGGNVPPQNLWLLTSPKLPDPNLNIPIPPGTKCFDAAFASLADAIDSLCARSKGQGERFYFYFSGHGITNDSGIGNEQALVMQDFTQNVTQSAVEFSSLTERFQTTQFEEQLFIVDACRDIPDLGGKFPTGQIRPGANEQKQPTVEQYILMATAPLIRAVAIGNQSVFTDELLKGLQGTGSAKVFDRDNDEYVVKTTRLFQFVEKAVLARKINVSGDINNPSFQKPRIGGEHGSQDPELARFPRDPKFATPLHVAIDPEAAWPQTTVRIVNELSDPEHKLNAIAQKPVTLQLEPMIYNVFVSAPGFKAPKLRYSVELYETAELAINLAPDATPPPPPPPPPDNALPAGITPKGLKKQDSLAQVTIKSNDRLAPLELADSLGKVLVAGRGEILVTNLPPGFYRARLLTPEGSIIESLVELAPEEHETLLLDAPPPQASRVMNEVAAHTTSLWGMDKTMDVSESVGPMASAQLSTLLTLAGSAVNHDIGWGHRLRQLGLKSFQEIVGGQAATGLHILSGIEAGTPAEVLAYLATVKLCLWPMEQPQPATSSHPLPLQTIAGLSEFAQASVPAPHWLMIEWPEKKPSVLALALLPQRLSMLVFHRNTAGHLALFQYLPAFQDNESYAPDTLRRLELAQRFYLSGRLDHAYETAKELLDLKWIDPVAGALGGYLMLKLDKANELTKYARNMIRHYGTLSDSHVLNAEHQAASGNDEAAKTAFTMALNLGVPIFAEGLARLCRGITKYQLEAHLNAALMMRVFEQRVPDLLWTAWVPTEAVPLFTKGAGT